MSFFFSHSRTTLQYSKRWGTLGLVNQLFKIYFKVNLRQCEVKAFSLFVSPSIFYPQINKLHLCKPLIRAIENSDIKDRFGLADMITYR